MENAVILIISTHRTRGERRIKHIWDIILNHNSHEREGNMHAVAIKGFARKESESYNSIVTRKAEQLIFYRCLRLHMYDYLVMVMILESILSFHNYIENCPLNIKILVVFNRFSLLLSNTQNFKLSQYFQNLIDAGQSSLLLPKCHHAPGGCIGFPCTHFMSLH